MDRTGQLFCTSAQIAMQLTDAQRRTVAALTRAMMRRLDGVSDDQRALAQELSRPPPTASAVHPDPAVVRSLEFGSQRRV